MDNDNAKEKIKNRVEFTKLLQVILLVFFYGFFIFSVIMWYKHNRYMSSMLSYISDPFSILIGGYMLKSGIDNRTKINKDFNSDNLYKKITFSKILIFLIVGSFIFSTLFFCFAWYKLNRFPTDLFSYISKPFITILPTYLAKSILENHAINNNVELLGRITDGINSSKSYGFTTMVANIVNDVSNKINLNREKNESNNNEIMENNDVPDEELADSKRLKN